MPIFRLDEQDTAFPPPYLAEEPGIIAVGGDLSPDRLLEAYSNGIFPWFNPGEEPLWWCPNPRFVLYPEKVKVSKSMRQVFRKGNFKVTFDQDCAAVLENCQQIYRPGQGGETWISDELKQSYLDLHKKGFIHSVEVWQDDKLVGGLYGGCMNKCFFGESMFAKVSNASKVGFIVLAKNLHKHGFELIDCQVHTRHLESLGAEMIPRLDFLEVVERNLQKDFVKEDWNTQFQTSYEF
ncbi:leucyl/phenylalanyl-tRNA--protein transferase [Limibacter armeniacum]|uniref:leucyl/phenylalanyl-tRNA--protein transferase n=1 Tax=Limibacter armeniacum TaxID=466084 RepID=UPI002FE5AC61